MYFRSRAGAPPFEHPQESVMAIDEGATCSMVDETRLTLEGRVIDATFDGG